jgi:3-oxoacyl-[acyl-carrier protein] reductase
MDLGLTGKTALITGAAGGIGSQTARLFLEEGARVAVADLRAPDSVAGADLALEMDVTNEQSVADAVRETERRLQRIDVLVNCAGIYRIGELSDVEPAAWDQLMDINLRGTYLVCRAALPGMLARGAGSIVNLASISGRTKSTLAAPSYVASKAGVIGLTMALASQSAARGVRVNAVAPGPVDTEMIRGLPDELQPRLISTIPLGRLGTAREIAQGIAFLASDAAGFITGETLNVNGGAFMV